MNQIKQEKINKITKKVFQYFSYLGLITILILPITSHFLPILDWQRTFWLMVVFTMFLSGMILLLTFIILFTKRSEEEIAENISKGPRFLRDLSVKKLKIISSYLAMFTILLFILLAHRLVMFSFKGINYLYIQNKQPIIQIDTVLNARAGTGSSKFTVQNVEFENLGKLEMWFTSLRFKKGATYEITLIPDTKYILNRTLIEE